MVQWNLLASGFFFQPEDGIRGTSVTGVQTCALPISSSLDSGSTGKTGAEAIAVDPESRLEEPLVVRPTSETDRKSVVEGNSVKLGELGNITEINSCSRAARPNRQCTMTEGPSTIITL